MLGTVFVGATVIALRPGARHGHSLMTTRSAIIIAAVMLNARVVGLHFLELRHASLPLRGLFEGYCAVLFVALVAFYLD